MQSNLRVIKMLHRSRQVLDVLGPVPGFVTDTNVRGGYVGGRWILQGN